MRPRVLGFIVVLLCGGPLTAVPAGSYDLGAGDRIEVKVEGESSLCGTFRISDEGTIIYPVLGAVALSGKTPAQVASVIRVRLAEDYLVSPQVAVFITEYASKRVAILGDVPAPGFFTLKEDNDLLSVLSEAGVKLSGAAIQVIITPAVDRDSMRKGVAPTPRVVKLDNLMNPWQEQEEVLLSGGDRVFVKGGAGGKVIVSGKVQKPGIVPLGDGLTVMEAINEAGGLAEFGSPKGVRVIRETPDGSDVMKIDLSEVIAGDRSKDIALGDGDIVVVPRRWF